MRGGRLLAEQSPERLLATYGCDNLEDVFLKLSREQSREVEDALQAQAAAHAIPIVSWFFSLKSMNDLIKMLFSGWSNGSGNGSLRERQQH